ncbi:MAG: hypothetical protein QRY72_01095 [Candidatus Rhabdochlamydia sp.]
MSIFNQFFSIRQWGVPELRAYSIDPIEIKTSSEGIQVIFEGLEKKKREWMHQLIKAVALEALLIFSKSFVLRTPASLFRPLSLIPYLAFMSLTVLAALIAYRSYQAIGLIKKERDLLNEQVKAFRQAILKQGIIYFNSKDFSLKDGRIKLRASDFLLIQEKKELCSNYIKDCLIQVALGHQDGVPKDPDISLLVKVIDFNQTQMDPFFKGIQSLVEWTQNHTFFSADVIFSQVEKIKVANEQTKYGTEASIIKSMPTLKCVNLSDEAKKKILKKSWVFGIYRTLYQLQNNILVQYKDFLTDYKNNTHQQMLAEKIQLILTEQTVDENQKDELEKRFNHLRLNFKDLVAVPRSSST